MTFGAEIDKEGVRFRLWAPKFSKISIEINASEKQQMTPMPNGWHEYRSAVASAGARYKFVLPDGLVVPDPASRYQPDDAHGPSEVIDPDAYVWRNPAWSGRPWEESIIYELHVGAFTPEGTFKAATARLPYLQKLGITVIELMPIADFPGDRNWGYDGVLLFAPESSYGRPDDLKAFIDAAHGLNISVVLDVVYNHFGPDGNYLPVYSPIFTETHHTPWGAAINCDAEDSSTVRELIVSNALYWIHEYNLDGLRLDAVHAIIDDSSVHILEELAASVRASTDRHIHLILENEENQASRLRRNPDGGAFQYTAQWNDDFHHVLHVAASRESSGYYADYIGDTTKLGRAVAEGFAFQGEIMPYSGHARGEPSGELPPTAFVSFIQNHDQIGNRAFGERISSIASTESVRALAAIYLLSPQIPMLFMGEEWAASTPFPFFCGFEGDLADAIKNGRRAEFSKFPEFHDPEKRELIPDPTERKTFESAKLQWCESDEEPHVSWNAWYRKIIAVRHSEIIPRLTGIQGGRSTYSLLGANLIRVRWVLGDQTLLELTANLNDTSAEITDSQGGRNLWTEGSITAESYGPWTVQWTAQVEAK